MKDFKSYRNATEKASKEAQEKKANGEFRSEKVSEEALSAAEQLTKKALAAYDGKSDLTLLAGLVKEAAEARAEGRLSDGEIEEFCRKIAPLLNDSQRHKLEEVVEIIKNG